MQALLRLLHLLAGIGCIAALAALLAVAAIAPATALPAPEARAAIVWLSGRVLLPALTVMLVTGLLLIAQRPALMEQGWVWAKGGLAMAVVGIVLVRLQPAATTAERLAGQAPLDVAQRALLASALQAEWSGGWAAIGLALGAVVLAVWRPDFAGRARP